MRRYKKEMLNLHQLPQVILTKTSDAKHLPTIILAIMRPVKKIILCIILFVLVVMPDMVLETLHGLAELTLEFLHIAFEVLEEALDAAVEHLFHTGLHETQIIVFYIIAFFALYGLYRLIPPCYRKIKQAFVGTSNEIKTEVSDFWSNMSLVKKLLWLGSALSLGIVYVMFFI